MQVLLSVLEGDERGHGMGKGVSDARGVSRGVKVLEAATARRSATAATPAAIGGAWRPATTLVEAAQDPSQPGCAPEAVRTARMTVGEVITAAVSYKGRPSASPLAACNAHIDTMEQNNLWGFRNNGNTRAADVTFHSRVT